jgi:hypothetical protein
METAMKMLLGSVAIGLGALVCQGVYAQDSAPAAGHTAQCKDGTYFDGTTHKGACKGHQGVKEWLDKGTAASGTAAAAGTGAAATTDDSTTTKKHHKKSTDTAASTAATPAAAGASTAAAGSTAASTAGKNTPPNPKDITQKAGGGNGQVWVNTKDKVYHCEGDEWYGKTKEGKYETAAQAQAEGAHAAKNSKACDK